MKVIVFKYKLWKIKLNPIFLTGRAKDIFKI